MATELAKAYVQIIPTAEGIKGKLSEMLGGEADAAGKSAGQKAGASFGSAFKGLATAGVAAIGAATTAAVGFAKSAVDVGQSFDAAMSQVAAVSGATGEDFDALRDKAQEMGASTKFSASEAADAMNYMAMAGWKTEEMLGGIEGIMSLAAASGESLGTTSDIVTDALTAFGMTAQDSARFADVLAAASSNANTNVGMMGETFKYVAPLAGALNFNAEDTATAIGLMANAGIKGSQAGTALRSILTRLAKPTRDAQTAMNVLGLSLEDEEGRTRSLAEVMDMMRDGFGKLQVSEENYESAMSTLNKQLEAGIITQKDYEEQAAIWDMRAHSSTEALQAQFAAMLGGQEALSGLLAIVNAAPGDYEKLTTAIYESDGAAAKMAATMQDNLAGDLTIMQSALEGAKIAISDQLTPTLREFVQFGTNGISELTTAFQEGGLSGAMEALGGILSDGLAMLMENLPQWVEAGMGLLSALGQGIMDNLPMLLDTATEIVVSMAGYLIEALPDILKAGLELIVTLAQGIAESLPELIPTIVDVVLEIVDTLTDPGTLSALIDASIAIIIALAEGLIDSLPKLLEKAPEILENLVRALIENVPKLLKAALEMILKIREGLIENLPEILAAAGNIIEKLIQGLIEFGAQLLQTGMELVTRLIEGIKNEFNALVNSGKEIIDTVKNGVQQKIQDAKNWGHDLVQGFVNGLKEKWENLKQSAVNLVNDVKNIFTRREGLDTHSPSKWAEGIFENVMEGGIIGLEKGLPDLLASTRGAVGSVQKAFWMNGQDYALAGGPAPAYGAGADIRTIQTEISATLQALRGMQVVMNGNALVGAIRTPMNEALGTQYDYNRRGIE